MLNINYFRRHKVRMRFFFLSTWMFDYLLEPNIVFISPEKKTFIRIVHGEMKVFINPPSNVGIRLKSRAKAAIEFKVWIIPGVLTHKKSISVYLLNVNFSQSGRILTRRLKNDEINVVWVWVFHDASMHEIDKNT